MATASNTTITITMPDGTNITTSPLNGPTPSVPSVSPTQVITAPISGSLVPRPLETSTRTISSLPVPPPSCLPILYRWVFPWAISAPPAPPNCCRFCQKLRDPKTVPVYLANEIWASDCFSCRSRAGVGAFGTKKNGFGVCKFCHQYVQSSDCSCLHCRFRVKDWMRPLPGDRPLLYYCGKCKCDIFPPAIDTLPSAIRTCSDCSPRKSGNEPISNDQHQICDGCGGSAGRWLNPTNYGGW